MPDRKDKRTRKYRGSRTHGYGRVGQHRKAGQRGGKGKTGGKKHDWTYVTAHTPNRFGKHGFHRPTHLRQDDTTINIGQLTRHLNQFVEEKPTSKTKPIPIDLTKHGYDKVLGAGRVSTPLAVTAPLFTHRAAEKIKAAGGTVKGSIQPPTKHPAPSLREPPAKPKSPKKTRRKKSTKQKKKPSTKTKKKSKSPRKKKKKSTSKSKSKASSKTKKKKKTAKKSKS